MYYSSPSSASLKACHRQQSIVQPTRQMTKIVDSHHSQDDASKAVVSLDIRVVHSGGYTEWQQQEKCEIQYSIH
jgi:hypothetical protein